MDDSTVNVVVCDHDPHRWRAVVALLTGSGCTIVGSASRAAEVLHVVRSVGPDVVVLDLTVAGERGVSFVHDLHAAAPSCDVVVLTPLDTLAPALVAAGAKEILPADDLRGLVVAVGGHPPGGSVLQRESQDEGAVVVDEIASVGPRDATGDRQPQA